MIDLDSAAEYNDLNCPGALEGEQQALLAAVWQIVVEGDAGKVDGKIGKDTLRSVDTTLAGGPDAVSAFLARLAKKVQAGSLPAGGLPQCRAKVVEVRVDGQAFQAAVSPAPEATEAHGEAHGCPFASNLDANS